MNPFARTGNQETEPGKGATHAGTAAPVPLSAGVQHARARHWMMPGLVMSKHCTDEDAYLMALYQNCGIWKTCAADFW